MSYKSSLAKARGWGAGGGTKSWWMQRLTSVALLPLVLWFVFSLATLPALAAPYMIAWISQPLNTILLMALIISVCWHTLLGLRVIVEDYVHATALKVGTLVGLDLLTFILIVSSLWAVLKISFGF